ncbi:MAG: dienelactone hydrolase family protein [Chloroflexi bacterium]|nr:dienelactone hydrolase family protein [Chloroflexota bacterium]
MKLIQVTFPCGQLTLEGVLHLPSGSAPFACVVVCHPHPLYGGDMDSNVVVAVCYALCEKGIAALRFNFRGAGGSEGSFGGGIAEREDVKAAISFVASREEVDLERIGLCGYSFGAIPSFLGALSEQIQAVAAISPPLALSPFYGLKECSKPKLLISGSEDNFTPSQTFEAFFESLPKPKEREVIAGADHFWWGHEHEVGEVVSSFFVKMLR